MVTAKNKTIYQANSTEYQSVSPQCCQNCGHHKHCGEQLWGVNLGGDQVTTYKKHMPNYYLICYTCQCERCR